MTKMTWKQGIPVAGLLLMLSAMGCDDTARGVAEDTREGTQAVAEAGREAGQEIQEETREAGRALNQAGERVEQGAKQAGQNVAEFGDAAEDKTRVNAALAANDKLSALGIGVETLPDAKGVSLNGTVASAEMKALAERVARDTLEKGKTVQNNLTVAGQ